MNNATPRTIPEYLDQLRRELHDADPALVQDALYDAEEYLRSELAENPGADEASLLAGIAGSYGAPAEVAAIYRDTEVQVAQSRRNEASKLIGAAMANGDRPMRAHSHPRRAPCSFSAASTAARACGATMLPQADREYLSADSLCSLTCGYPDSKSWSGNRLSCGGCTLANNLGTSYGGLTGMALISAGGLGVLMIRDSGPARP